MRLALIDKVYGKPWFKSSMVSQLNSTVLRCVTHAKSSCNSLHRRGRIAGRRFLLLILQIDMAVCMAYADIGSVGVQLLLEGFSSLSVV